MSDAFVAEIRILPCNFAPRGWAFCNGQLLPISQNTALFSLVGTNYGGDGRTTFGLPNLQGRSAVGVGQGPGLSLYDVGQSGGSDAVTLLTPEMPAHGHTLNATASATTGNPAGAALAPPAGGQLEYRMPGNIAPMAGDSLVPVGGAPHNNLQPYLVLNFCIALQGIFPPRA